MLSVINGKDIEETISGLNFHPPITITNSKKMITLISTPIGICL